MYNENIDSKVINTLFLVGILLLVFLTVVSLSVNSVDAVNVTISDSNTSGIRGAVLDSVVYETIYLNPGNYSGVNNTNITISNSSRNIVISGNGSPNAVTINGEEKNYFFYITNGAKLTLKNLTLINGISDSYDIGALRNNNGTLVLENCIFKNNKCNSFGGVLYTQDSTTISNCEFINNTAPRGGAIYISGGQLSISNSKFTNNSAVGNSTTGFGGAIYSATNAILNIFMTTFTDNNASRAGGAIYAQDSQNVKINESSFINNKVTGSEFGGGALYTTGNFAVTIIKSNFTLNTVFNRGGAIYSSNCTYDISESKFDNNTALMGGAIFFSGRPTGSLINIAMSNFTNNSATDTQYGGGALVTSGNCDVTIINSNFVSNNAFSNGGAIYSSNTSNIGSNKYTISGSTFKDNTAQLGGAIYNLHSDFTITNSLLDSNIAKGSDGVNCAGGAIYQNNGVLTISYSNFTKNSATKDGARGGSIANVNGVNNINFCQFNENQASTGSAIFNRDILNLRNSNFTKNGYALAIGKNTGVVENCIFIDNTIAIGYTLNSNKIDWAVGSNIFQNNAYVLAIDGLNNNITIKGSLANNKNGILFTSYSGGNILRDSTISGISGYAIVFDNTQYFNTIEKCTISNNLIGVYINGSRVTINNSNINNNGKINNHVASRGAGIYNNLGNLTVTSCNFYNNIASNNGSAIANIGGTSSISYSNFIDNSPNCAVYNSGGSTVANLNWWGTNNPTTKTNFALANYFTMNHKITTKSNTKSTGETISIQYIFALNGTTNNFNANSRFLYFSTDIINNDKIIKTVDGRLSANYNIYLSTINNNFQVKSGSHITSKTLFKAKKGPTKVTVKSASILYKKSSPIKVIITGKNKDGIPSKTILFYVNDKYIGKSKTNSKGIAILNYKSSNFSKKALKVVFKEDSHFKKSSNSINLGVVKSKTSLKIQNFIGKYKKKGEFSVVLIDQLKKVLSKKTINFYINGKEVGKAMTNKKGIAIIKPIIRFKGKVNISAKFLGESIHKGTKVSKSQKI